jgi:hypothetical protein
MPPNAHACFCIHSMVQEYSKAHVSIVEAVAGQNSLLQVSWYACTVAANDMAAVVIASMLAQGCMLLTVDEADGSFYRDVMLMKPDVAAGHISIELSDHVLNNVFFMVCLSPIMQVGTCSCVVPCRVTLCQWQNELSAALAF